MSQVRDMRTRFLVARRSPARPARSPGAASSTAASFTVGFKGPQDYLTEVDGEIEALIAGRCSEAFPEDGFLGEESEGAKGRRGRADLGRRSDRRHRQFRARLSAFLRFDRLRRGTVGGGRRHLRSHARRTVRRAPRRRRHAQRGGDRRRRDDGARRRHRSRSAGTCGLGPSAISGSSRASWRPARRRRARAPARSASPMSRPAGATAMSSTTSIPGTASRGLLLIREAGGYVSDFLAGEGLRKGAALIAAAPGIRDALIAAAAIEGISL